MKRRFFITALAATTLWSAHAANAPTAGYPITPVPFTSVKVWNNSFWGQR